MGPGPPWCFPSFGRRRVPGRIVRSDSRLKSGHRHVCESTGFAFTVQKRDEHCQHAVLRRADLNRDGDPVIGELVETIPNLTALNPDGGAVVPFGSPAPTSQPSSDFRANEPGSRQPPTGDSALNLGPVVVLVKTDGRVVTGAVVASNKRAAKLRDGLLLRRHSDQRYQVEQRSN